MKLTFQNQKMTVTSVNPRAEMHGQEREPAGDIHLRADLPNNVLSVFDPALKAALYWLDNDKPKDLVEQGRAAEPGYLPDLKFPMLGSPLAWDDVVENARVTIKPLGARYEIVLEPSKVNDFKFTPRDGGTVTLQMRVQTHPDEQEFGRLSVLVKAEVEVTLEIPEPAQTEVGGAAPE